MGNSLRRLVRPALAISAITLLSQLLSAVVQVLIAALFGAGIELDAYFAALTLPTYFSAVLLGGLSYVFVPLFVEHRTTGSEEEAWKITGNILTLYLVVAGSLTIAGMVWARELLALTVPGLSDSALTLATLLARILWPSVFLGGLATLCVSLYQSYERFIWPALAPLVGGVITLTVLFLWGRSGGVHVLAFAVLTGSIAQAVLLAPILIGRLHLRFDPRDTGVREALVLLAPLVFAALFAQGSKLVDRYVASHLGSGSISHLAYGDKITTLFAALLSAGIAVTIFPQMAKESARADLSALRQTVSLGLRLTWLLVAPAIGLGIGLAYPLIGTVLERGAFGAADTAAVASILHWYLLALIGMTLGNITARAFYALKDTRTLSLISIGEIVLYALYTPWFGRHFGVMGIGVAIMLYWNLSELIQCVILWQRFGRPRFTSLVVALSRITAAAAVAGLMSHFLVAALRGPAWAMLLLGGTAGLVVYLIMLQLLGAAEWLMIIRSGRQWAANFGERAS